MGRILIREKQKEEQIQELKKKLKEQTKSQKGYNKTIEMLTNQNDTHKRNFKIELDKKNEIVKELEIKVKSLKSEKLTKENSKKIRATVPYQEQKEYPKGSKKVKKVNLFEF